jgi:molybdopterin-guanine dinucleotide biosynthesis protein A
MGNAAREPRIGVVGLVLAGGASSRFGSPKTLAWHAGEPLIHRPLRALLEALGTAAVACKPDTPLPDLPPGVEVWTDESEERHPLSGIVAALDRAGAGRVAVLACDMPGVTAGLVRRLCEAGEGTTVARSPGGLEPLAAVYAHEDRDRLAEALAR